MLTCSEVFLNSSGHILDIHCLRMYNLRNSNKMAEFRSKGFSFLIQLSTLATFTPQSTIFRAWALPAWASGL